MDPGSDAADGRGTSAAVAARLMERGKRRTAVDRDTVAFADFLAIFRRTAQSMRRSSFGTVQMAREA